MNEIWKKNREKLLARMEMFSAAVLFAGKAPIKRGDENYPFSPDRNFYYVTGIEREDCILFLAKTRTGVEETLYIPRDNGVMAKWVGANMTAEEATAVSGIEISVGLMPLRRISPHIYSEAALRKSGLIWKTENGTGNVPLLCGLRRRYTAMHRRWSLGICILCSAICV